MLGADRFSLSIKFVDDGFDASRDAQVAKALTLDEARRIASNIAASAALRETNAFHALAASSAHRALTNS